MCCSHLFYSVSFYSCIFRKSLFRLRFFINKFFFVSRRVCVCFNIWLIYIVRSVVVWLIPMQFSFHYDCVSISIFIRHLLNVCYAQLIIWLSSAYLSVSSAFADLSKFYLFIYPFDFPHMVFSLSLSLHHRVCCSIDSHKYIMIYLFYVYSFFYSISLSLSLSRLLRTHFFFPFFGSILFFCKYVK